MDTSHGPNGCTNLKDSDRKYLLETIYIYTNVLRKIFSFKPEIWESNHLVGNKDFFHHNLKSKIGSL